MEKNIYLCEECNYKTNKLFNFKRHNNALHKKKNETDDSNENLNSDEEIIENNTEDNDSNKNLKLNEEEKRIELFCEKCNKKYLTKKHLDNHLKKCNGLDSLTCSKCMYHFSTSGAKSRHIKDNNCKPKSIIHATSNFDVNNYGSERTDYINIDDIIKELKISETSIIPKYIELKHFNDDFPENRNIKYEKNNDCLVKKDGKWKITNLNHMSEILIIDISTELKEYVNIKYNTKHYNSIKTEIKDIIKSSRELL